MDYLDGLSDILSGTDICTLLLYRDAISEDLMDRIIEYNKSLDNEAIANNFSTPSRILELFGYLASIADRKRVLALCDEIANAVVLLNQDNICLTEDDLRSLDIEEQKNIDDLLDLIENGLDPYGNGSGTPGDPAGGGLGLPPPVFNFDCPDLDNYVNDPTVTRMLPEVFSNLVEFVELQFLYSADAVKRILLDTSLSANPTSGLTNTDFEDNEVGIDPSEWPELPQANSGSLEFLEGVISMFQDTDAAGAPFADMLQACIAENPDLVGQTAASIGIQLQAALDLPSFQAKLNEVQEAVTEIATSVNNNPGGPVTTQYVFKRQFYDKFINYIDMSRARLWDDDNQKYTVRNHFVGEYFDSQHRLYSGIEREKITFSFPRRTGGTEQSIQLNYVGYVDATDDKVIADPLTVSLSDILGTSNQIDEFKSEVVEDFNNLSLVPYVDAIKDVVGANGLATAERKYFPYTYAEILDQVFDYFIANGIFDAASLNAVNFFHDNLNCAVGDVADLLDVQGIFDQMQDEYLESACQDSDIPSRNRLRDTIKIGMFLLLIQVHIAEFIIKNIFVFSAIKLDDLFGKEFIVVYMRDQIRGSIDRYFDSVDARAAAKYAREQEAAAAVEGDCPKTRGRFEEAVVYTESEKIRNAIIDIFNRKVKRVSADGSAGIKDLDGNIVFPAGTLFRYNDDDFYQIVDFLTEQRITLSMGTLDSPGPVSNALTEATPMTSEKTLEDLFLSSFKAYTVPRSFDEMYAGLNDQQITAIDPEGKQTGKRRRAFIGTIGWKQQLKLKTEEIVRTFGNDLTRPAQPSYFNPPADRSVHRVFWTRTHVAYNTGTVDVEFRLWQNITAGTATQKGPVLLLEISEPLRVPDAAAPLVPGAGDYNGAQHDKSYSAMFDDVPLNPLEIDHILAQPEYKDYFSSVFSQELITLIPIIQNFYLTNLYFSDIEDAMQTTKDRVISILSQTIQNQDHFDTRPRIRRSAARNTALSMDTPNTDTMARDYILKMLIMTPINILKGVIEMIDPHVVVTKIIKTGTGAAFNALAAELDKVLDQFPDSPLSGSDLLGIILCMIAAAMGDFPKPEGAPDPPTNFFPRISLDGVDFTGTISGMLMIPPTPLGLIYLLLSLINIELPGPDANVAADFGFGGNANADLTGRGEATRCEEDEE
tara:strand:- start:12491 stop:15973 length:3483 start_codon:yes stop_codon:yes gene_type:complete